MKKNFIKVSVICALTLASSATMVSCSDYDDDIKNHQEQIDALKKQLDASKTEITEGLNTAIEGLEAEIKNIAGSKADAASVQALEQKAAELQEALNSKASNEQITALADEVKGLINDVNTELSAAMEGTKTELQGQISTLEQKQEDLQKELATLTSSSNTANQKISALESQLQDVKDDLANTQSKHDALQTSVTNLETLLKGEINDLKTQQTELSKQIANCSSKEEVAALKDDLAKVKEDLTTAQGQLALLNTNVASLKSNLESQISKLTTDLNTTNKNLEAAVAAQNEKVEGVQSQLDEVNEEMISINDRLQVIEAGNYGERITKLEQQIVDANNLIDEVKQKSESEIARLDVEITTRIEKAIADAKAEISADYGSRIETLQNKFSEYITVNAFNDEVTRLEGLIDNNTALINGLIQDKIDPTEYGNLKTKVDSIWEMVKENGTIDEKISDSINSLNTEIKGILGNMIQSVAIVPSYYTDGSIVPVGFSNLVVTKDNSSQEVAENINDVITLRVTPTCAAEDFANKYNVVFEGSKTTLKTRSAEESYLKITNVEADKNTGIVKLSVTRNSNFDADSYYNLCAHITLKDDKSSDPTNISSNFFLAQHKTVTVNKITVKSNASAQNFVWNKTDQQYSVAQNVQIIGTTTENKEIDLEKEFGKIFTVSYKMASATSPFTVDPQTGVVKLKEAASDMIGVSDYVIATAYPTQYGFYSYPTDLPTFTVIKEQKAYANSITLNWSDIATKNMTVNFPLNEIARQFGVSVDDAIALIKDGTTTKPDYATISTADGNNLAVTIKRQANVTGNESIVIRMKDDATSVTQSATEYTITIKINSLQYTSVALPNKQSELWNGNTVVITPKVNKSGNKISGIELYINDIKTIYTNISEVATNAKNAGAYLQIFTNKPAGVSTALDYKSNGASNVIKFTIDKNSYTGTAIQGKTQIVYTSTNGPIKPIEEFQMKVLNISGTFTAPSAGSTITMDSKNGTKKVSGFRWDDYLGNKMWEDGVVSTEAFTDDPFSIYAMSKPTFSMSDKFLQVNANTGAISFTPAGKDYNFTQNYEATLQVKIPVSKWGTIQGLNVQPSNGYYVLSYKVIIPKDIK